MLLAATFVVMALGGCSESACEKADAAGHPTHACYVENRKLERETEEDEEFTCREAGWNCGPSEADERREFREGWEEAEKEAEFYGE